MASSSDWMAQAGAEPDVAASQTAPQTPGWMAALGLSEPATRDGFREISPFGTPATDPEPAAPPETDADSPEPASPEEEAYMRGFSEGHAQAKHAGDVALAGEEARYRELRMVFRTMDEAAMAALATDLNTTVLALCEPVLGDFATDREALTIRCHEAAKRLGAGPRDLTLNLHPETRARIDAGAFTGWSIEEDATLMPGAVRLVGADGSVRDGPEDWMRAFAEALSS